MDSSVQVSIDINGILDQRGICESCTRHDWQPQGNRGWKYPVYDLSGNAIGHRLKLLQGDRKYLWSPSKPNHELAEWYILPGTAQAIANADGVCYLANGEPTLHAYHSATVYNSLSTTLSEIAVPKNAIEILRGLGITRLLYPVDNDRAGYDSAINWRDALSGSGIDFEAFIWGNKQVNQVEVDKQGNEHHYIACDDIAPKADGNDIWIDLQFNPDGFMQKLHSLKTLILPEMVTNKTQSQFDDADFDETPQGLIDAIANRLGISSGYNDKGWSRRKIQSPFRTDKKPSFNLNKDTGVGKDWGTDDTYSPIEIAMQIGIDWRTYYPKPEYTPEFTPEQRAAAIAKLEASLTEEQDRNNKLYADAEKTILSADATRYATGDYRSWWDSKDVPKDIYSALFNLASTRSETARVLGLIHKALIEGRLSWVLFTESDLVNVTGLDRRIIHSALKDLQEWSFVRFLSGDYIYNILHSETVQNYFSHYPSTGRKPKWYSINFDLQVIEDAIYDRLEVRFTEKIHNKTYAQRTRRMMEENHIEKREDWLQIQKRNEIALSDSLSRQAARKLSVELEGDATYWYGWRKAFDNPTTVAIDWSQVDSIKDLRAQLLIYHIENIHDENTREDLRRVIGGSDSTLQSLYEDYNIGTQQQFARLDIEANFEDLRNVMRETQQEHRGLIRKISFKYQNKKEWDSQLLSSAALRYAELSPIIERVWMLVCKPSKQWLMSEEEIQQKQAEKEAETGELETISKPEPKVIAASTPAYKTTNRKFDRKQAQIAVHMFTPHELIGDTVFDENKIALGKIQNKKDIELFLNQHAIAQITNKRTNEVFKIKVSEITPVITENHHVAPLRTSADFWGQEVESDDKEISNIIKLRREKESGRLQKSALVKHQQSFDTLEAKTKVVTMPQKESLTAHEQRVVDFSNTRYEAENKGRKVSPFTMQTDSSKPSHTWIDAWGFENELRGDTLYIDGVPQAMNDDLWRMVQDEITKAS